MTNSASAHSGAFDIGATLLTELIRGFEHQKEQAERALAQLDGSEWADSLDREANSIAVLVRHLVGNLTSRWTDFLSSDGEKASRHRDGEFESSQPSLQETIKSVAGRQRTFTGNGCRPDCHAPLPAWSSTDKTERDFGPSARRLGSR